MNKWLFISVVILYFLNNQICWYIYPEDVNIEEWNKLKYGILTICFYLALEYKPQDKFFEKVINAVILNNAYVLIFENEITYSYHDIIFICTFTGIQYIKYFQKEYVKNLFNKLFKTPNR
jgi:phosphatidylglycerophosphate synthase